MPGEAVFAGEEEFVINPNPAIDEMEMTFYVTEDGRVEIRIYDLNGKNVLNVYDGHLAEGEHVISVNVSGLTGGMYVAVMKAGEVVIPRRIVIIR
jgi:hypothetical protein